MDSLLINDKEIMKYWNYEKNNDLNFDFNKLSKWSKEVAWWKCEKGHEWQTRIRGLASGSRCPYCAGQKVLRGYNDLATTCPEIMNEWDFKKNTISPYEIPSGTSKEVWWKCNKGHSYMKAVVKKARNKEECPYCSNRKVLKGYNDLATTNPELAKEWNYKKNDKLTPFEFVSGSNKKVWWICNKGHEWQATISSRALNGNGCRQCAIETIGSKIMSKTLERNGNLLETHPRIVEEWNYEKNGNLKPENFHFGSTKKVWWKCSKGHEWQTKIVYRTKDNLNCPICATESHSSFPEQTIFFYCNKYLKKYDVNSRYMFEEKNEADIFIKKLKLAIEYDGAYYHNSKKSKEKEEKKNQFFINNNIKLIRIKENYNSDILNDDKNDIICLPKNPNFKQLDDMLVKLFKRIFELYNINKNIKFNTQEDRFNIMDSYIFNEKENSLLIKNPELAKEWNYEKNGNLKPDMVTYSSGKKVWWKCSKGHEWEYVISDRNHGDGCPICSNRKLLKGYNDLATTNPELAKEWNYDKNIDLTPDNIVYGSNKKVWWKCSKCNNEWQATLNARSYGRGCPYCINKKVKAGYNDLATINPELLKEWDYDKNNKLKIYPNNVSSGSCKRVWWKCSKCGYEWKTTIGSRTKRFDCPKCGVEKSLNSRNKNMIEQKGSLLTEYPEISKYWNYKKNNDLTPEMFRPLSNKKVWWICDNGHEYEQSIDKKVSARGCPYCSNKKVLKGYNDLATTNPELLKEWNYDKNNKLGIYPDTITSGAEKKVWWKCSKGHEWQVVPYSKKGCPYCLNVKILEGYNDLKTTLPEILEMWNYKKNNGLKLFPNNVIKGSSKKAWWICPKCNNEWFQRINHITSGIGCPKCHYNSIKK